MIQLFSLNWPKGFAIHWIIWKLVRSVSITNTAQDKVDMYLQSPKGKISFFLEKLQLVLCHVNEGHSHWKCFLWVQCCFPIVFLCKHAKWSESIFDFTIADSFCSLRWVLWVVFTLLLLILEGWYLYLSGCFYMDMNYTLNCIL